MVTPKGIFLILAFPILTYSSKWAGVAAGAGSLPRPSLEARWWVIPTYAYNPALGPRSSFNAGTIGSDSVPGPSDTATGVFGVLYVIAFALLNVAQTVLCPCSSEGYAEHEGSVLHFLYFFVLTAFTTAAYLMPLRVDEATGDRDAWAHWFDAHSTGFIQNRESPLNYFDTLFCALGLMFSTFALIKNTFRMDPVTRVCCVFTVLAVLPSLAIGITFTTDLFIPIGLLSITAIVLVIIHYIGLFVKRRPGLELRSGYRNGSKSKRSTSMWLDSLELSTGLFSIVFHLLMICVYGESSVLLINAPSFAYGVAAFIFAVSSLLVSCFGSI